MSDKEELAELAKLVAGELERGGFVPWLLSNGSNPIWKDDAQYYGEDGRLLAEFQEASGRNTLPPLELVEYARDHPEIQDARTLVALVGELADALAVSVAAHHSARESATAFRDELARRDAKEETK